MQELQQLFGLRYWKNSTPKEPFNGVNSEMWCRNRGARYAHVVWRGGVMNNRTIMVLFVCGTFLAGSASAAQRWGTGPRPDAGACFYEYPNFQGRYFCARAGEDLPFIPNGMNE